MTDPGPAPAWQPSSTPVGPAPGLAYGGFWIRTVAYLIDVVILAGVGLAISSVTGVDLVTVQTSQFSTGTFTSSSVLVSPTLPGFLVYLLYFAGLWSVRGQTIGMMPFGLRVLRASDGERIGPGRAIGRFFGLILAFAVFLIGVIWVAADGRKQGWHDKLARTVVVRPARGTGPPASAGP